VWGGGGGAASAFEGGCVAFAVIDKLLKILKALLYTRLPQLITLALPFYEYI
jgi:hypothetical protein